jgi:hypothetical protein
MKRGDACALVFWKVVEWKDAASAWAEPATKLVVRR